MGKTVRYFQETNEEDKKTSEAKSVKIYKINKNKKGKPGETLTFKANLRLKYPGAKKKSILTTLAEPKKPNPIPKFPGRAPVDKKRIQKHSRGEGLDGSGVKLNINKYKLKQKEKSIEFATDQAARAEILLTEEHGLLEAEAGETTTQFRQQEILENVDISAATKHFDLILNDFGPYRMRYTRNGRHLVLGGKMGHIAAFDWVTKKLHCEFNVMESVHDVCWLHIETMLAVAQKNWVHIYDQQGIELHCLRKLNKVSRMQFLPYHFLLATASEEGYLSWLDISIGKMVNQYNGRLGKISMMCQNPWNAVLCLGSSKGVVSMWSPNMREPLAKMLCHRSAMTSLDVDPRGLYLATGGTDRSIKIWDIRKMEGPLQSYRTRACANDLSFSEQGLLGVAMGNVVEVFKDCCTATTKKAYLRHVMNTQVSNMQFCPYEDVLGVATAKGFTSLLVPGSGEPNFDALEANPYQTKKQRQEAEVKSLLEKIQPEFITLDPSVIAELDIPTLQEKLDAKKKLLFVKPQKIDLQSRKTKKRGSSVQAAKTKNILQEEAKREYVRNIKNLGIITGATEKEKPKPTNQEPPSVLDRFLPKNTK